MRNRSLVTVGLLAAVLSVAGAAPVIASTPAPTDSSRAARATPGSHGSARFIVKRDSSVSDAGFTDALRGSGFRLVTAQSAIKLAVVSGPAGGLTALRTLPGVATAAQDYAIHPQSLGFDYKTQPGSMTNTTGQTWANDMWVHGYTGAGVDVALLDTGVAPVPSLSAADKVVIGPDLSFESQAPNARYLDSYGHGTVMAGIIAGREVPKGSGASYAADTKNFYGMAPDARLISLKMADRNGSVDVSQMIAGIDWVVTNRRRVGNIRVINLSYGAKSSLNPQDDPLSWAAEAAWKAGIVVVASSGNDGQTNTGLASPAYNPWVLAVGAEDTHNTSTVADDTVATFSNTGDGQSKGPDLLAPGVGIIGPSAPGSYIATTYPGARIGNGFIRGSGTSQAAAVVTGAVALTLQEYPGLTPDELKRTLMRIAATIPNLPASMQGKGTVRLGKLQTQAPDWGYKIIATAGNGKGALEGARGGHYVTINGTALKGETDIMGHAWDSPTMAALAAQGTAWDSNGNFNGFAWTGGEQVADTTSWVGKTWQGKTWQSSAWQSSNWVGKTWQTGTWTSTGWSSATWASPVAKTSWGGATWASASWG